MLRLSRTRFLVSFQRVQFSVNDSYKQSFVLFIPIIFLIMFHNFHPPRRHTSSIDSIRDWRNNKEENQQKTKTQKKASSWKRNLWMCGNHRRRHKNRLLAVKVRKLQKKKNETRGRTNTMLNNSVFLINLRWRKLNEKWVWSMKFQNYILESL